MNCIKRVAIVAMAVVIGCSAANAGLRFGVKAGVDINKIQLDNFGANFDSDNRCGFTGGVMLEYALPITGLCVDASLMYTRMNSVINTDLNSILSQDDESKAKDFLNVPINVKYKLGLPVVGDYVKPYIFTGPDFAFKLGGKDDVLKTRTFQCAWNIGLGLEIIKHLQIQASYGFGMNNVFDKINLPGIENVNLSDEVKAKNNYWTVTAAWLF